MSERRLLIAVLAGSVGQIAQVAPDFLREAQREAIEAMREAAWREGQAGREDGEAMMREARRCAPA